MTDYLGKKFDNYVLVDRIKPGQFCDVFLGKNGANQEVAIKVLHTGDSVQEKQFHSEQEKQFHSEFDILRRFKNPHIIGFEGGSLHHTPPYILMEYVGKHNLRDVYPEGTRVELNTVVAYIKQIAEGLQYIHDIGYIHNDLRPENILVNYNDHNNIRICDFHLAEEATNIWNAQISKQGRDTKYMAPEQVPSFKSDQYSLGVMVFEWLSGKLPQKHTTSSNGSQSHEFSPLQKIPGIPSLVETVVQKALNSNPNCRYPEIKLFATELEQASRLSISSKPPDNPSPQPAINVPPPDPKPGVDPMKPVNPVSPGTKTDRRTLLKAGFLVFPFVLLAATGVKLAPRLSQLFSPQPPIPPRPTPKPTPIPLGHTYLVYRGHTQNVNGLVWSPNVSGVPHRIASASFDATVQVWDALTGDNLVKYTGHHGHHVNDVTWSPDGTYIASCQNSARDQIHVWQAKDGKLFTEAYIEHKGDVNAVVWASDLSVMRLASASFDGTVQVWEWNQAQWLSSFTYPDDNQSPNTPERMFDVSLSNDNNSIAFCSQQPQSQVWTAKIDAVSTTRPIYTAANNNTEGVQSVAWSPDNKYIAVGFDINESNPLQILGPNGQTIATASLSAGLRRVAWSPHGTYLAGSTLGGDVVLWRFSPNSNNTLSPITTYSAHRQDDNSSVAVNALAWSPDGQMIASGDSDGVVRVWQAM